MREGYQAYPERDLLWLRFVNKLLIIDDYIRDSKSVEKKPFPVGYIKTVFNLTLSKHNSMLYNYL